MRLLEGWIRLESFSPPPAPLLARSLVVTLKQTIYTAYMHSAIHIIIIIM